MTTLSERIKLALAEQHISQAELARRLGVTRQSVSLWCSSPSMELSASNALRLAQELEVDPYWLVFGRGNMRTPRKLELHESEMISVMNQLDTSSKELALKLVSQLKQSA